MNLRRDVFQAIADRTRRAILLLVASHSMTAGAIAANFDTARPTVSKHLQILTECELLEQEQNGREVYYHFNPKRMKEVADFIEPFRKMWDLSLIHISEPTRLLSISYAVFCLKKK